MGSSLGLDYSLGLLNSSGGQALGSYSGVFALMVNLIGPLEATFEVFFSAMNTSSSIIQCHSLSSVIFALNKVTEHSLKDPLHSIPLSQLDSTYQFKQKHEPILTLEITMFTWYPA